MHNVAICWHFIVNRLSHTVLSLILPPTLHRTAYPVLHDLVVGEDTGFKVAPVLTFHTHTCARKVSRSDISSLHIKYHQLEMHPRTAYPFQVGRKDGVAVKVIPEHRPWFFGVYQPHINAFLQ